MLLSSELCAEWAEQQPPHPDAGSPPDGGADRDPDLGSGAVPPRRTARLPRLLIALLCLGYLLGASVGWGSPTLADFMGDFGLAAAALTSAFSCLAYACAAGQDRNRSAWLCFGVSSLMVAFGNGAWGWYEVVLRVPVPVTSIADYAFLMFAPPAILGLLLLANRPRNLAGWICLALDGWLIAGSLLTLSWSLALARTAHGDAGSPLRLSMALAYPVLDILLISMVLGLRFRGREGNRAAVHTAIVALALTVFCDALFTSAAFKDSYHSGELLDAGWFAGSMLLAWAPWAGGTGQPRAPRHRPRVASTFSALTPYVAAAVCTAGLLYNALNQHNLDRFVLIVGCTVVFALIVRQGIMLLDNLALAQRLARQEQHFRSLVQGSSDVIMIADPGGVLRYVSPAAAGVYGRSAEEIVGTRLPEMVHPDDLGHVLWEVQRYLAQSPEAERTARIECRVRSGAGAWLDVESTVNRYRDGLIFNCRDISERVRLQAQLEHNAFHDTLTDLPNRALFLERGRQALSGPDHPARRPAPGPSAGGPSAPGPSAPGPAAGGPAAPDPSAGGPSAGGPAVRDSAPGPEPADDQRPVEQVAVLFLDLDGFKAVNDNAGHQAGDELLVQAARRLQESVRTGDTVARLGGDEFAVLLVGDLDQVRAEEVAERLRRALSAPYWIGGEELAVAASIGIAFAEPGITPAKLLRNADLAMYQAKKHGKDRVSAYTPELRTALHRRTELDQRLRVAVREGQFALVHQPVVDLATGAVAGLAARARWRATEGSVLTPAESLHAADGERASRFARWMVEQALLQAAERRDRLPEGSGCLPVAVRLSARRFTTPGLQETIETLLRRTGLPGSVLRLELAGGPATESRSRQADYQQVEAQQFEELVRRLAALRRLGVGLALDGLGGVSTTLSGLRRLPVDAITLEPGLVAGITDSVFLRTLTASVLRLSADLGLSTVAEGVDRPAQAVLLGELGCRLGQGPLYGGPLEQQALDELLRGPGFGPPRLPGTEVVLFTAPTGDPHPGTRGEPGHRPRQAVDQRFRPCGGGRGGHLGAGPHDETPIPSA